MTALIDSEIVAVKLREKESDKRTRVEDVPDAHSTAFETRKGYVAEILCP